MKHANISTVLRDARFPWIDGYKPRSNDQGLLSDIVLARLEDNAEIQRLALRIVESPVSAPSTLPDLLSRLTAAPSVLDEARDALAGQSIRRARKGIDYLAREQHNRAPGKAGKTTSFSALTPFYLTSSELEFSG